MEALDTFSRTFLPATALANLPKSTIARHVQVLRRCAGDRDAVAILARCTAGGRRGNVFMLTRTRLVVTSESGLLRRVSLHLNADLHQLADVAWTPEPGRAGIQLGVTAIDGVRENFWVRLGSTAEMWRLDEALRQAFRVPLGVIEPARQTVRAAAVAPRPELSLA
ncbi:hypothetical protein [Dactylosporangium sp. CA-139066]|uniref:hypothetical protein n=1 Tax=Dactylosporangium sp. CA-139066 TaxID=3239930 RepID=UPI003D8DE8B9